MPHTHHTPPSCVYYHNVPGILIPGRSSETSGSCTAPYPERAATIWSNHMRQSRTHMTHTNQMTRAVCMERYGYGTHFISFHFVSFRFVSLHFVSLHVCNFVTSSHTREGRSSIIVGRVFLSLERKNVATSGCRENNSNNKIQLSG